MANAMVALANLTIGTPQATVTFGSIPTSGYRDLRLVATYGLSVNGKQVYFRVNSDSGANYYSAAMTGYSTNSTIAWAQNVQNQFTTMVATGLASGDLSVLTVDFSDYSQTDKHKATLLRSNHSGELTALTGRWGSTSAITTIQLLPEPGGGNFVAGSTFELFGIVS